MGESSDWLPFNGVSLFELVIENTRSIDNLPFEILVVHVSNVERFGGERVRLDLNICSRQQVDEWWLSNIGEARKKKSSRCRVDGWKSREMLAYLEEIKLAASPQIYLTSSRYSRLAFCLLTIVHILPRAAVFKSLQRYNESPNFKSLA